jgi:hypothetical protein
MKSALEAYRQRQKNLNHPSQLDYQHHEQIACPHSSAK